MLLDSGLDGPAMLYICLPGGVPVSGAAQRSPPCPGRWVQVGPGGRQNAALSASSCNKACRHVCLFFFPCLVRERMEFDAQPLQTQSVPPAACSEGLLHSMCGAARIYPLTMPPSVRSPGMLE